MMRKRNAPTTTAEVLPSSNPSSLSPPKNNGTRTSTTMNSKSWTTPFGYFLAFVISLLILVHIYLARVVMTETTPLNHDRNNDNNPQVTQWPPSDSKDGPVTLTPLQPKDYDQYTIRINTWKRNEQLIASVLHHRSCPGVAEIQVIWCNPDEAPPDELVNLDRVVIERHSINTLNERFHIIPSSSSSPSSRTPTLGILSIDDDVLRPCQAIDAAFFQWLQDPSRILGFDGRSHVESSTEGSDYTWQVRNKVCLIRVL